MIKVVLDTNMFLSGFLFHGMIKTVFGLILTKKLQFYISRRLKSEIVRKMQAFNVSKQVQKEVLLFLVTRGVLIKPAVKVTVCRDKKDDFLLELAESAGADYLITRDRDLLELPGAEWKNTKIVKPEKFLPMLRSLKIAT